MLHKHYAAFIKNAIRPCDEVTGHDPVDTPWPASRLSRPLGSRSAYSGPPCGRRCRDGVRCGRCGVASSCLGSSTLLRRETLALATLALTMLASAARADAFLYWTNYDTGTIARAALDGTGVAQRFVIGANGPVGIAADG